MNFVRRSSEEKNLKFYDSGSTINEYEAQGWVQKPEAVIADLLRSSLGTMDMLDLGVGAGRTTKLFGPLVTSYVGVDYAEGMVASCRKRFPNFRFEHEDARALTSFQDQSFDFVLFSYNGIDYVSYKDRAKVLAEIRRVLRPGGVFCFSTHNLQSLKEHFRFKRGGGPRTLIIHLLEWVLLRTKNPGYKSFESSDLAEVRDGTGVFQVRNVYIRPRRQVADLRESGFSDIRCFPYPEGEEFSDLDRLESLQNPWIYFLSQKGSGDDSD